MGVAIGAGVYCLFISQEAGLGLLPRGFSPGEEGTEALPASQGLAASLSPGGGRSFRATGSGSWRPR